MTSSPSTYAVPAGATLPALLHERYRRQANDRAVHIDGSWLTYAALGRQAFGAADALVRAGIGAGDRIGTLLPNTAAFLATWLGAAELGATLVPVNPNLTGETLRYIVQHAALHALIVDAGVLPAYTAVFGEQPPAPLVISHGADLPGATRWEQFIAGTRTDAPPPLAVGREQPALIIYTSGTTGRPKGVVLSRAAQLAHGWYYGKDFVRLGPGETAYTCLPLFHVTSMGFSLGTLLGGAAVAIDARFSPFAFWDAVRRFDARIFPYVGAMIGILSARPEQAGDNDNPVLCAIGSATPLQLWEPFEQRFGLQLIETYGQSETASLWMMPPPHGRRVGTVGKPAPRMAAMVVDAEGKPLPPDTDGELWLRPHDPWLMAQTYFRDDETMEQVRHGAWYATGDAGSRDIDGHYRFAGRLKEFIRRRGENISAYEIEREALTHPAVREAAAVGVPSTMGEEEIKLCVIPDEGTDFDPASLFQHLRPRLAAFMLPRYIQVYDDFPRTATQRVQKFRLVEDGVPDDAWDRTHGRSGRQG